MDATKDPDGPFGIRDLIAFSASSVLARASASLRSALMRCPDPVRRPTPVLVRPLAHLLAAPSILVALASTGGLETPASAQQVVFDAGSDNGFFTPFNSSNAATVRYGDSGWLGPGPGAPGVVLGSITLRLATWGSALPGTTDVEFTLNDGDPSGLVFGTGAVLYATTITGVELPAAAFPPDAAYFELEIPLPNVATLGGFNNVGWSIRCRNFSYQGQFGFQVSTCGAQYVGFYTNNASYFNGSTWSLFSFGQDPCTQVANYSVTIRSAGCAADLDGDGEVSAKDLATLLASWGEIGKDLPSDLDGDGVVDALDLASLLGAWGACP